MKLKDLKTGMVIEIRNGERYLILRKDDGVLYAVRNEDWFDIHEKGDYNSDLTDSEFKEYDIMKIYEPCVNSLRAMLNNYVSDPIWERKNQKKMTVSEICKELGYEVEIVRDDS